MSNFLTPMQRLSVIVRDLGKGGIEPDSTELVLLQEYAKGRISAVDMLAHARQFATATEYEDWQRDHEWAKRGGLLMGDEHEQVVAEIKALINRRRKPRRERGELLPTPSHV
jgi:hypothetical protein